MRGPSWLLLVAIVTTSSAGWAQAKPVKPLVETLAGDARDDYAAGKLLFGDGDFAGAAIKFDSAYQRSSDARLLWNIAACEKNLRHYARTVALVKKYLATGGDLLTASDRAEASALLTTIEPFTIALTIQVSEPDAELFVDDVSVGRSPLKEPIVVDIGIRKIAAKKTGFGEASVSMPLGGSRAATVELKLAAEVHEGSLAVTTAANAHIFLDNKEVGVGAYRGKLSSGGHTLRVVADKMQPYQSEVVLSDNETRSIDVPLVPEVDVAALAPRPPSYRGFYGILSTPALFGFGGAYVPPSGVTMTTSDGTVLLACLQLALGYTFGNVGIEGIARGMFGGHIDTTYTDASVELKEDFPILAGFFGVGARASTKHPIIRLTAGLGFGVSVHQILKGRAEDIVQCDQGCPSPSSNDNGSPSPGWTSFAMSGDAGILLGGGSPTAKFWLGVDWSVDFPPGDIVVHASPNIPSTYTTKGGITIVHNPQFFIGPVIGVGFGH